MAGLRSLWEEHGVHAQCILNAHGQKRAGRKTPFIKRKGLV